MPRRRKNSAPDRIRLGALCLVAGVALIIGGRKLAYTWGGQMRYLFTGSASDETMMLIVGGGGLIALGVYLVFVSLD